MPGHGDDHAEEEAMSAEVAETVARQPTVLIMEGLLTKKGASKMMASWKKRWFTLSSDALAYFEKQGGAVKGGILLETVRDCRPATQLECTQAHSFVVDTEDNKTARTYLIQASSDEERDKWVAAIKLAVEAHNAMRNPPKPAADAPAADADAASAAATAMPSQPPSAFNDPIKVGYWNIRSLGAPLRMMCVYARYPNAEFPVFEVTQREDGSWDRSTWVDVAKPEIAKTNPLANLPFIHNTATGQVITQSSACVGYLARRLGLYGNEEETTANEQLLNEAVDLRTPMIRLSYSTNDPGDYAKLFETSGASHCAKFTAWLEQRGTKFLVRDELMAADFTLWEVLDTYELVSRHLLGKSFLDGHSRLKQYWSDFQAEERMKPYLEGDLHRNLPLNNKMAKVGGAVLLEQTVQ